MFIESPEPMLKVFWDINGLVCEYDLAVPETIKANETIKNKIRNTLDFFEDKS